MGGFTYLIGRWQRAQFQKSTYHYSKVLGEAVCDSIAAEMEFGRSDKVQETLEHIGHGSHIRSLFIFDPQGRILRSANPAEVGKRIEPAILENHLSQISEPFQHFRDGEPVISFIKPFPNSSQCQRCHDPSSKIVGFLDLELSIKPMEELVSSSEKFLLGGMALSLLAVAGSILLITSRWIRVPLSKVMGGMRRVEEGHLDARVNLTSRDELGKVAQTFNTMVEALTKAKRDLEILHQRELERTQKMATLGELAAGLAHEIRNPLAGIATASRIICSRLKKDDPQAEVFDEINDQAYRLEKVVSNLIQFAGTSPPRFSSFNLHEIVEKTIELFSYQICNQRIDTEKEFQSDLPHIYADQEQIRQVLMNLVLNSIQAMPEGGKLRFKTFFQPLDERVHLVVGDTGVGIPQDLIPKIFKPFYTTKAKGAGLGLATVEKIIEEHKGKVTVRSEVGTGTEAEICLPTQ
jgi:signal transduction histidine kinase